MSQTATHATVRQMNEWQSPHCILMKSEKEKATSCSYLLFSSNNGGGEEGEGVPTTTQRAGGRWRTGGRWRWRCCCSCC